MIIIWVDYEINFVPNFKYDFIYMVKKKRYCHLIKMVLNLSLNSNIDNIIGCHADSNIIPQCLFMLIFIISCNTKIKSMYFLSLFIFFQL